MSSTRKVHLTPSYALVDTKSKLDLLQKEILRLKPEVEVSLPGDSTLAKGRIVEWFPSRHFFSVEWKSKSESFDRQIEINSECKAYFKVRLLSTQLVFKCVTVRRLSEKIYHFRIPEEIFQQQRRGALRVPIYEKSFFKTAQSEFEILDLSVSGARLKIPTSSKLKPGSLVRNGKLKLGKILLSPPLLEFNVTSLEKSEGDPTGHCTVGGRFYGLQAEDKSVIKQFLIEALRIHFEENP